MRRSPLVLAGLLLIAILAACGSAAEKADPPASRAMVDAGSWYSRQQWPHDGDPYESSTFVVYSDAASDEARREVADVAEGLWAEVLDEFATEPDMLRFPEGQHKIHIYAYRDYAPQDWGMRAYHGGLIMWSPDHPTRPTDVREYGPVVKHEFVHVLESLLKGRDGGVEPMTDTWFSEGLAEVVAGGTAGGVIRDLQRLDRLTDEYGRTSPIWFKRDAYVTIPGAGFAFNYPTYQLAVEYLLDDAGFGKSLEDARDLFLDMGDGASFEPAFGAHMGVPLDDYERSFFTRMDDYLPRHADPLFTPLGFAVIAILATVLLAGFISVAYRHGVPAGAIDDEPAARSRSAAVGFGVEVGATTVAIITFFVAILSIVGTAPNLHNAMESGERATAYWMLGGYVIVSAGLLVWGVRRWCRRSRSAWLVAPLAVGVTVATFLAIAALL